MIRGTEAGARIRAAVVDMKGKLSMEDWEGSSANVMGHVWMTDCDSLYEHLVSTKHNSVDNKRLNVDLMALRQLVWERGGERQEYVDKAAEFIEATDKMKKMKDTEVAKPKDIARKNRHRRCE